MMHAKALGARIRCRSGPSPDLLNDVTLTTTRSDTVGTPGPHFISSAPPPATHPSHAETGPAETLPEGDWVLSSFRNCWLLSTLTEWTLWREDDKGTQELMDSLLARSSSDRFAVCVCVGGWGRSLPNEALLPIFCKGGFTVPPLIWMG